MGCGASKQVDQVDTPQDPNARTLQRQISKPAKEMDSHHNQFLQAAKEGNLADAKKFAGIVDLNVTNDNGDSALILAAASGNSELVRMIIEKRNKRMKPADLNHQNDDGDTALHTAARGGHALIVSILLSAEALPDIANKHGKLPEQESTKQDVTKEFADAKASSSTDADAAEENGEEKDITEIDEDDYREWLNCAMTGDLSGLRSFVDIKKLDVNYNDGWTALLCAAQRDHVAVCEYLLSMGAEVDQRNTSDCTALHLLTTHELAKLLLDNGASLEAVNEWGDTPLHDAAWHGRLDIVDLFVQRGADVNSKNKCKATPLHHATKYQREDVVKYLLEHGAEPSYKDEDGKTAMDHATTDELKHLFMTIG